MPQQRVSDGTVVCLGGGASGVLHLPSPLAIAGAGGPASAAALNVLRRVKTSDINAGLVRGGAVTLRAPGSAGGAAAAPAAAPAPAAVKLAVDGEFIDVQHSQLLELLASSLR